jgi:putative selenate reductase
MRLGDYDASGRRGIAGTGETIQLQFDTVIGAVGARVETEAFTANGIALNAKGFPAVNASGESSIPGVYIAGDCKAGAATVVKAIAGGKAAARDILRKLGLAADFAAPDTAPALALTTASSSPAPADLYLKKGLINEAKPDNTDGYRCLSCNTLCEICVDVCPNRANVVVPRNGAHQIVHIDRLCNECGNCATFCPHAGKPYRDKYTVFSCEEDFADSENSGVLTIAPGHYKVRLEDKTVLQYHAGETVIPPNWIAIIETIAGQYSYMLQNI